MAKFYLMGETMVINNVYLAFKIRFENFQRNGKIIKFL